MHRKVMEVTVGLCPEWNFKNVHLPSPQPDSVLSATLHQPLSGRPSPSIYEARAFELDVQP